jgi:energy-converting hydrogenase Eha subunit C
MGHPHWIFGKAPEAGHPPDYGETVIVAALLVMLPMEAVTVTCPPVVRPVIPETKPADTVAKFVLLEFHVATEVTSCGPLQVAALAVSCKVVPLLLLTLPLVLSRVIDEMHPTVTVTVCVPLSEGF